MGNLCKADSRAQTPKVLSNGRNVIFWGVL